MTRFGLFLAVFVIAAPLLSAQIVPGVIRGEVRVEMDAVTPLYVDVKYPLDTETTHRRALEEAAMFFSAMIYGWSFEYEIGERARNLAEVFELNPLGSVEWGDPRLAATGAEIRDSVFYMWADYRMDEPQQNRYRAWHSGMVRSAQALGYAPLGQASEDGDWLAVKNAALEDAARAAVRGMLRGSERNRPKAARGYISLASFPLYRITAGRWNVSARFRVEIQEIDSFSAY